MFLVFALTFLAHSYEFQGQSIGHRLGGDLVGVKDNQVENIALIKKFEKDLYFGDWEFDVNSTKDGIVLNHDHTVGGMKLKEHDSSFWGFDSYDSAIKELIKHRPIKRVKIDVKLISVNHAKELMRGVDRLMKAGVDAYFITTCSRRKKKITKILANKGYRVELYSCKADYGKT
jgi:hypothetical protein